MGCALFGKVINSEVDLEIVIDVAGPDWNQDLRPET
jgi:hypothetical protein